VRSGDSGAFGVLYERHSPVAQGLARQYLHGAGDADDVVAETFARVLDLLKRGAGPSEAFRPYLLASVRRVAIEQLRRWQRQIPTEAASLPDPGEPFDDPVLARLEQSLVAQAFQSLPERWSAVLWHTEVEQTKPADVALLFGLTPNGVAALSYRAREGLRQAYLQLHLSGRTRAECRRVSAKLGAHVRGGLSARDSRLVEGHLQSCPDCRNAQSELAAINGSLRGLLAPAFLGAGAAAAAAHLVAPASAAASAASAAAVTSKALAVKALAVAVARWFARLERWRQVALAGAVAAVAVVPTVAVIPQLLHQGPAAGATSPGAGPRPTGLAGSPSPAPHSGPAGRVSLGSPAAKSGSPAPSPSGSSGSASGAELHVNLSVSGSLQPGRVAIVTVHITDPSAAATGPLTVSLAPSAGLSPVAPIKSPGWTCAGWTCSHAAIGAGVVARLSMQIRVVGRDGCGLRISATVTGGSAPVTVFSGARVQCQGRPPHRSPRPHPSHSPKP
jgi:RNA polymerase sigma factor (sigma-70 family)